jgi:molecular chaperone DnaK
MPKSIGIDLGTTNSVVAIVRGAKVDILRNPECGELTRSVVSKIPDNPDIIVGNDAYDIGLEYAPESTIRSIKRLIGRNINDPNVQKMKERYPFKIIKPSGGTERSVAVILGDKEYTPEEISALILGKLKTYVGEILQDDDLSAIITVPAYFNDKQKDATRKAGWLAGLKVQRILSEPTAAALSYGIDEINQSEGSTIVVYDFGGGTFDVSILTIGGGAFVERGKDGDMWLGGDDFDTKIADYVLQKTAEEYLIDDINEVISKMEPTDRYKFNSKLLKGAEDAKIRLSTLQKTSIRLAGLLRDESGMDIPVNVDLSRAQFEDMILESVDRSIEIVKTTVVKSEVNISEVDKILLVGGSTLIPLVYQRLVEIFGKEKVLKSSKPMLVVAEGAAILSNRMGEVIECPSCGRETNARLDTCSSCSYRLEQASILNIQVVGSLPHDYAIRYLDVSEKGDMYEHSKKLHTILKKGDQLPSSGKAVFKTGFANQRLYRLDIFNVNDQEENEVAKLWGSLPEGLEAGTEIVVSVVCASDEDADYTISVPSLPEYHVKRQVSRGQTNELFYLDFEDLLKRFDTVQNRTSLDEDAEFWRKAERFVVQVNGGNYDQANSALMSMKKFMGEEFSETEYRRNAELFINWGEYVIHRYNSLIDADQSYQYRRMLEELRSAVDRGDKNECTAMCDRISEYEKNNLSSWIFALEYVRNASKELSKISPKRAAKYEQLANAVLIDISAGRFDDAKNKIDSIMPDIEQIHRNMMDTDRNYLLKR